MRNTRSKRAVLTTALFCFILQMRPRGDPSERMKCLDLLRLLVSSSFAQCLGIRCRGKTFLLSPRIGSRGRCLTFWNADAKSASESESAIGGFGECG